MLWLPAMVILSGCETVKGWTGNEDNTPQSAQSVSVSPRSASGTASTRLDSAPGVSQVPNFPPPSDADLGRMAAQSDSSVEVFDPSGSSRAPVMPTAGAYAPPAVQQVSMDTSGVPAVARDYQGVSLATDSSVTVYPLDGDMTAGAGSIYGSQNPFTPSTASTYSPARTPRGPEASIPSPRPGNGVSSVYFPYGSAQIAGKEKSALDTIAQDAKFAPVDRVRIEGHASPDTQTSDPVEARILNLRESLKRAGAVSEKLIQKGVPAEKIQTVGWGDTVPAGNNAEQRRVDIVTGGN